MISLIGVVLVLGGVILAHELGHFFVAKLSGVAVLRLSVGFGPALWSVQRGGTEYRIGLLPLGGYVKLAGQNPADPETIGLGDKAYSRLSPSWRGAILLAGPVANVLLGAIAFAVGLSIYGLQHLEPVVDTVAKGSPAAAAGLRSGDRIVEVDGQPIEDWGTIGALLAGKGAQTVSIAWLRDGARHERALTPEISEVKDAQGNTVERTIIGVTPTGETFAEHVGAARTLELSARQTWQVMSMTFEGLYGLATGTTSMDALAGPVGIAQLSGRAARAGVQALLVLSAIFSINIAVLNLLPIPVFDGGGLLFVLIEAIRGRPLGPEIQARAQFWSVVFLVALSLIVLRNDLARLVGG